MGREGGNVGGDGLAMHQKPNYNRTGIDRGRIGNIMWPVQDSFRSALALFGAASGGGEELPNPSNDGSFVAPMLGATAQNQTL